MNVRILGEIRCHLGEGATYDPRTDTAWWFDILERTLFEHRFASDETRVHDLPFMASALARVDGEHQLLSTEHGLYMREVATGRLRLHKALWDDDPTLRSNDARTHPSGAFWVGTMSKTAENGRGSIYWYRAGEVRKLFGGITITNCICFSPAGDLGYFTDTRVGQIMVVALDPATGLPTGDPQPLEPLAGTGNPDGAVVDAEGRIFVARWGGAAVSVLEPSGRLIRSIDLPARQITCPAFVGGNGRDLLVTSAFEGMDAETRRAAPEAGATFRVEAGATGKFDPDVLIG